MAPRGGGRGRIPPSAGPQAPPPSWQGAGAAAAQEMEDAGLWGLRSALLGLPRATAHTLQGKKVFRVAEQNLLPTFVRYAELRSDVTA